MVILLLTLLLAAPNDVPAFVVDSPADERPTGQLLRLTRAFTASLKSSKSETTIANVISLRRVGHALPPFPTGPHIVTTTGDRIVGTLVGGDGQSLRFLPSTLKLKPSEAWQVPLSSVVVLWLTDIPAHAPLDANRSDWLAELKNRDVVRFRNGDTARGTIDGLDSDAVRPVFRFRPERGTEREIASRELTAVGFNPALARTRKPKGAFARIVLVDGSRLALTDATVADDALIGVTLFGEKAQLPLSTVVAIDIVGGKAIALSGMKPKKVEQAGFLGVAWPWTADRSVRGDALRVKTALGEATADKGIGTHPRTVLTYDLGGKYRRFEALVGLDPDAAIRAAVTVRVLVDGQEQTISGLPSLTGGNAVPIRVAVAGAKELTLITDFGPAGGVGGDVNWLDARLVE
jgi:hypothetical protein